MSVQVFDIRHVTLEKVFLFHQKTGLWYKLFLKITLSVHHSPQTSSFYICMLNVKESYLQKQEEVPIIIFRSPKSLR